MDHLQNIKRLEPLLTSHCSFLRELARELKKLKGRFEIELDIFSWSSITKDFAVLRLGILLKHKEKEYRCIVYLNTMAPYFGKPRCFSVEFKRNLIAPSSKKHDYDFVSLSYMMATLNFRINNYEKSLDNKRLKNHL